MKYIVVLAFILISNTFSYSQNDFHKRVLGLEKMHYSIEGNHIFKVNWYNEQVIDFNLVAKFDTINSKSVLKMEAYYIKGKKQILPKSYGNATIEQWTFKDSISAVQSEIILKRAIQSPQSDCIHKAPWNIWREKNVIYFILTRGNYMRIELDKIEKKLKKVM